MINIKTEAEIQKIKKAGQINYLTHKYIQSLVKAGITTGYLNDEADKFIRSHDAVPGFLNHEGFPKSICISINDEVVHGIPGNRVLQEGDIVSFDIGVLKDGYHSDSAWTVPVGKINEIKSKLLKVTEKSLYEGLKEIRDGAYLNNIGYKISHCAHKNNLSVIKELVGHGVGTDLHEEPDIPNFGKYNTGIKLKSGMVIAVEPMLNAGTRHICQDDDGWTIVTQDGQPSAHFEHTVVVRNDGYEILTGE